MLTALEISGFKSFPKNRLMLRPLTLLCGLNNSGKSSIIQALRMFCNSLEKEHPLLAGHGSVDELRSRLVSPKDPIYFVCEFDNGASTSFSLNDGAFTAPDMVPLACYVSADRWGPKISLPLDRRVGEFPEIGDRGEYVIGFLDLLRNLIVPPKLHHPKAQGTTLEYEINGWLEEIAPGVKFFYETDSKRDATHIEFDNFRPTNVGFGLSYALPILAAVLGMSAQKPAGGWEQEWGAKWERARRDRGIVVMLENPEAHLHPRGQTALGRLIALGADCGIQLIVETQSDHLMDGIRIAIKEKLLNNKNAVFHYMSRNSEGETTIETPDIDPLGKLSFWPEGFFDQTLKNRAELAR